LKGYRLFYAGWRTEDHGAESSSSVTALKKAARGRSEMPQVTNGTISETKYEEEYLGHWRITDKVLMVTLGIYSEAVPIGGMETNPEALARQVFVGLIDLYLARKRKSRLRLLCDVPL
jgi:hypothetical protein